MTGAQALAAMAACYGAGALASLLAPVAPRLARWAGHAGVILGGVAGAIVALGVLQAPAGTRVQVALPQLFPFAPLSLTVDGLSAFFLLVVSLVAVAAGLYGPAYLDAHARAHGHGHERRGAGAAHVLALNVFVGSTALLPCAGDLVTFLLLWEGMTLASYALIVAESGRDEHLHAGLLYVVMAHAGTALLLFVFLCLADRAGGASFDSLRAAAHGLSPAVRSTLFFLALAGFAAKAGVVPLHVWLPYAHPAAPSHVSALMSGVMLKVALYGILRFAFDFLTPAGAPLPPAWGWTVLALGTLSAVIGVLYALQQHDLKRLLAFSSVENVGIILMGFGLAMLLAGRGGRATPLATLALAGALLHALNHAAFKGLLFLGAGSVLARAGTGNMEQLGGLARRMKWTAWFFLAGAVAISALPPLNGFVSEWMTFQALVGGGAQLDGAAGLFAVLAASMLALTGGLAAACFVKAFGVTFLGRPRSPQAEAAREAPVPMLGGMAILAAACAVLGVVPGYAMSLLDRPTAELLAGPRASDVVTAQGPLVLGSGGAATGFDSAMSTTAAAALFAALAAMAGLLFVWRRAARRRLAPTWTCGMTPQARFDYTATAFAKPLRLIFALLYRPRRNVERETAGDSYVVTRVRWRGEVVDVAELGLYQRLQRAITSASESIRRRSTGRIHGYIGFVLVTLLVVLLIFGRG